MRESQNLYVKQQKPETKSSHHENNCMEFVYRQNKSMVIEIRDSGCRQWEEGH